MRIKSIVGMVMMALGTALLLVLHLLHFTFVNALLLLPLALILAGAAVFVWGMKREQ